MLKRTKGRILLTMLVITGLAGTINNTSLSTQERKFAINQLKHTRTDLLKSIKGLTEIQLNFKPSLTKWSIKEHLDHIALTEKRLWVELERAMKKPATPEDRYRIKMSDKDLLDAMTNGTINPAYFSYQTPKVSWETSSEAASFFKSSRAQHLKYIKTTTGDLRNRLIHLPFGWVDCYQFILFISGYCDGHIRQIHEIMADPAFPQK